MKSLLLTALICNLSIANAFAEEKTAERTSIPQTAILVQTLQTYSLSQSIQRAAQECKEDVIRLAQDVQSVRFNKSETLTPQEQAQYECKNVYLRYKSGKRDVSMGRGLGTKDMHYIDSFLQVYCEPRSLREKQVMSLQKACEKDPKAECFSETFLKYIDSVKPTKFIYVNQPSC